MGEEETGGITAEMRMKRKEQKQRSKKTRKVEKRRDARRMKMPAGAVVGQKKKNVSVQMKRLYRKRARDYNSDDDDGGSEDGEDGGEDVKRTKRSESESEGEEDMDVEVVRDEKRRKSEAEAGVGSDGDDSDGDGEGEEGHRGVMRFVEGIDKFKVAFQKIMKSHADDGTLGPVLAAKKKLVVAKLAEEAVERNAKGVAKKEKLKIEEIGHKKPAKNFLDTHDKFLIGVATKGVVKLFNAVNKAQNAEKGLEPSRFKDAKVLTKRRKEAFRSELNKSFTQSTDGTSKSAEDSSQPAWAPLRDTYMSMPSGAKKNWDKMEGQMEGI